MSTEQPEAEETRTSTESQGRRPRSILVPVAVIVAVALLALAALGGGSDPDEQPAATSTETDNRSEQEQEQEREPEPEPEPDAAGDDVAGDDAAGTDGDTSSREAEIRAELDALAAREPDDPRAMGDVDAPVVMLEYADFLCPYCGRFALETKPELIERYVDTGILRIEWRDLPFQGDAAFQAAIGGQAAARQDGFWAFHDAMFEADLRGSGAEVDEELLVEVATGVGLDPDRFRSDLGDPVLIERVREEAAVGQSLGITGTPAFIVGGRPIIGAQPLEAFVELIEQAATEAGASLP